PGNGSDLSRSIVSEFTPHAGRRGHHRRGTGRGRRTDPGRRAVGTGAAGQDRDHAGRDRDRLAHPDAERGDRRGAAAPARSGTGKRVVYSLSKQRVWLIDERNRVVRYYAVSGPRRSLPVGAYKVYERASTLADDPNGPPAQYVVRFAYGRDGKPLAFETVPGVDLLATGGQPSRDVRQRAADARALWDFAPVGTKIIVIR
ncbi:L,D-transpeptidase, partial [Carbonactinospora thermoautotrophica]|uniref:L,D-transpeptidase n=1 Tax=Carbonactinospora thermoautotrophica TaxID=1469144 RepID=UPI00083348C5